VEAWAAEALELYGQLGDAWGVAFAEFQKASLYTDREEFSAAVPLLEASVDKLRAAGDEHRALLATRTLAWCYEEMGDSRRQIELTREILERARISDDKMMEARALGVLAGLATDEGRSAEAMQYFERMFHLDQLIGDPDEINLDLVRLARILALGGQPVEAATLIAVRQATRPDPESKEPAWVLRMEQEAINAARANLNEAVFSESWTKGERMSIEEAVRQGLAAGASAVKPK
jgi:tetratricopeptide (TPR) repeat protein